VKEPPSFAEKAAQRKLRAEEKKASKASQGGVGGGTTGGGVIATGGQGFSGNPKPKGALERSLAKMRALILQGRECKHSRNVCQVLSVFAVAAEPPSSCGSCLVVATGYGFTLTASDKPDCSRNVLGSFEPDCYQAWNCLPSS